MIEKRFELAGWGGTCSDIQMETLKSYDECKQAAYELGRWFNDDVSHNQTTVEIGCYVWGVRNDGCNGCESGIAWISDEAGSENPNLYRENVCRRNGNYDFICYITHIERLIKTINHLQS